MVRCLLINPNFGLYAGVKGHGGASAPLNLAYIAAYLRKREPGLVVSILDSEGLGLGYEQTVSRALEFHPDVVGITTTTPSFDIATTLARKLQEVLGSTPIVAGGVHVTALPEETASLGVFRAVVLGEGEETAWELFNALLAGAPLDQVKGIAYFNEAQGRVVITPPRPLIKDLDSLPFPARDLLPMENYFSPPTKSLRDSTAANIISSRGCPFNCTYCMSRLIWRSHYRRRSPQNVLAELEEIINNYSINEFNFNNDLFTAKRDWLTEFCEGIIERKWDIRFVCNTRVDMIDPPKLQLLKRAGCDKIALGLESGSKRMLGLMNKKVNFDQVPQGVQMIKDAGIKVGAAFVLGHYGETRKSIRKTIDFAKHINPHTVAFFQASPYPGTSLYRLLKENGCLHKDASWADYAIVSYAPPVYDLPGLPGEEINRWVKRAYREFYLRPAYVWQRIKGINSPHEIVNLFKGIGILANLHRSERK